MTSYSVNTEFLNWIEASSCELNSLGVRTEISEGFLTPCFEGGFVDFFLEDIFGCQISIDPVYGDFCEILDWSTGERIFSDHVQKITKEIFNSWKIRILELAKSSRQAI